MTNTSSFRILVREAEEKLDWRNIMANVYDVAKYVLKKLGSMLHKKGLRSVRKKFYLPLGLPL